MEKETEQFNIRLPRSLIYDLDFISRATKLPKGDWVRYKLCELVRQTREKLLVDLENAYVRGSLTIEDFKETVGVSPSKELTTRRTAYYDKMINILNNPFSKDITKKTLQGMIHKDAVNQINKAQLKPKK